MYRNERGNQKVDSEQYQYASDNSVHNRDDPIGQKAFQFCCNGAFYYVHGKYGQQYANKKCDLVECPWVAYSNVYGH